jgi:hypothetical protein
VGIQDPGNRRPPAKDAGWVLFHHPRLRVAVIRNCAITVPGVELPPFRPCQLLERLPTHTLSSQLPSRPPCPRRNTLLPSPRRWTCTCSARSPSFIYVQRAIDVNLIRTSVHDALFLSPRFTRKCLQIGKSLRNPHLSVVDHLIGVSNLRAPAPGHSCGRFPTEPTCAWSSEA